MSKLLEQLHDEILDFSVSIFVNGKKETFDFLDIVNFNNREYAVLGVPEEEYVEIFLIKDCNLESEYYEIVDDEKILNEVFEIFKKKNEDEFDFD